MDGMYGWMVGMTCGVDPAGIGNYVVYQPPASLFSAARQPNPNRLTIPMTDMNGIPLPAGTPELGAAVSGCVTQRLSTSLRTSTTYWRACWMGWKSHTALHDDLPGFQPRV